jgi:hypothetical protein
MPLGTPTGWVFVAQGPFFELGFFMLRPQKDLLVKIKASLWVKGIDW